MVRIHYIDLDKELTEKQIKELEEAENAPYVYDEDCPEITEEMAKQFVRVGKKKTLRHSQNTHSHSENTASVQLRG